MNREDGNKRSAAYSKRGDASINNEVIKGLDANRIEIRESLRVYSERRGEGGEHGEGKG